MSVRGRRGLGVLEMVVAAGLAALLAAGALALMHLAARAERRTSGCADASVQAALAVEWLARDLARLLVDPDGESSPVAAVEPAGDARLDLILLPATWGEPAHRVAWRFQPATGQLVRTAEDGAVRAFALGPGARVTFERCVALDYRITASAPLPGDPQAVTLVGSAELAVSRDAFPYWN